MMAENQPNRVEIDLDEIDFYKLTKVGKKVTQLIFQKMDEPTEIYLLLKMLCFSFEEATGIKLDSENEILFRQML